MSLSAAQQGRLDAMALEFHRLTRVRRRRVHDFVVRRAIENWWRQVASKGRITYVESVVGTTHELDPSLPADALEAAETGENVSAVHDRFLEPLTALQDGDLELADTAQFALYAVHNYFERYANAGDADDWTIVNQAMASEDDDAGALDLLERALAEAR